MRLVVLGASPLNPSAAGGDASSRGSSTQVLMADPGDNEFSLLAAR